ncbi:MAG: AAA family ATPase [Dysgonamonadaceae bacterium]|nr:AAA family ATPase [Dysgonamonadaceae bacterium]MDD4729715.1 AAA family ATPase [Dysgonamonadaceae bacterium]
MKVIIRKFKRLENLTVNVPAEITGGNGIGKTSILEAISFVLTGKDQNGKEFAQVYDNRVDLHDAIADVSYFDDYGNEFRRVVEPTFTTSRSGEETLKIMRSTRCTKNGIDTNDFSGEFQDFYNFGTDFFFNQKETDQRAMFIDLMKSLLPDYDVAESQLRMKSLKKTQRDTQSDITAERKALKLIQDVEVKEMPSDLEALENEYQNLIKSSSSNQSLISEINRKNNELFSSYRKTQSDLESKLQSTNFNLRNSQNEIERLEATLNHTIETNFEGYPESDTSILSEMLEKANSKLSQITYFTDINDFAKLNANKNPIVSENMERMKRLRYATPENLPEGEKLTDICSSCGVASQSVLDNGIKNIIDGLKAENKQILESEMRAVNGVYLTLKDERDRLQTQLNRIEEENKKIVENAEKLKRAFDIKKTNQIEELKKEISIQEKNIVTFEAEISDLEKQLSELKEPTLSKLPTELTISDELQEAHNEYQKLRDEIVGAKAVNANNKGKKALAEIEIKKMQTILMEVDTEIIKLQEEITDYFSNLTNVVDNEFSGKIKIGVQLQELIISKDEYKDVFKITADGKVFPHECNGALINNTKLQVLATLQRLKGYNGITIMDNAEANTTQSIEPCGLNLVIARATGSKELIIK